MSRSPGDGAGADRRESPRFLVDVPAARCGTCDSSNRTSSRQGPVCADCGAPWPTHQVERSQLT